MSKENSTEPLAPLEHVLAEAFLSSGELVLLAPIRRAEMLRSIASDLEMCSSELVEIAVRETGLTAGRLTGEVARTVNQCRFYADVIEDGRYLGITVTPAVAGAKPPVQDHRRINQPLGPVLVFASSNFPFAFGVLGTDTASALAAGCAVVAKSHPGHPELGRRLHAIASHALLTAGIQHSPIGLIEGRGDSLAALEDSRIQAGAFTGSIAGGTALMALAQRRSKPIPFFAEMGSVNPVVVTEAAWLARRDEIISGFIASMSINNGQLCTSPGLLFTPADVSLAQLVERATDNFVEAPLLTDSIAHDFRTTIKERTGTEQSIVPLSPVRVANGRSAHPIIWRTSTRDLKLYPELLDETFGPSAIIVEYADIADIIPVLESMDGQLTGSVFAEPFEDAGILISSMSQLAGRVVMNSWPTGVAVSWSMHHGGPWPASSTSGPGSVGAEAIGRFLRPITFQNFADDALPIPLQDANPWRVPRAIDGEFESVISSAVMGRDRGPT